MDTCSRRIVGWSIDTVQDSTLVVNALDMHIIRRRTARKGVNRPRRPRGPVHVLAFTDKVPRLGSCPPPARSATRSTTR